jgi:hypothetical protein
MKNQEGFKILVIQWSPIHISFFHYFPRQLFGQIVYPRSHSKHSSVNIFQNWLFGGFSGFHAIYLVDKINGKKWEKLENGV